jgi:hypothetical protein
LIIQGFNWRKLLSASLLMAVSARSNAYQDYSSNDFGLVGLMQTPTARMADDGEFRAGVSTVWPYNQLLLGVQLLPWLETQLRYVDVRNRLYGPEDFSGDQHYKDRGVDFKLHLVREGEYLPDIALGVMDIGGTGLFASEYLVANRRYRNLDISLGLGWGRLGSRGGISNPFKSVAKSFGERPSTDEPGGVGFDRFFHGSEIGLFGGLQWQTPVPGVSVKLEYDGNDYQSEALSNDQKIHFPVNAALNWRVWDALDLSAGVERGDTAMFRISAFTNFNRNLGPAKVLDPPATPAYVNEAAVKGEKIERSAAVDPVFVDALKAELSRQKITLLALDTDRDRGVISVWFTQTLTRDQHRAIGRIGQTLATLAPPEYQAFTAINVSGEVETYRVTLMRRQIQDAIDFRGSNEELRASAMIDAPRDLSDSSPEYRDFPDNPEFTWSMGPALRQSVGGPDEFYFGQLWWRTGANLQLTQKWSFSGAVGVNIYNNFDGLKNRDLSSLPHVRSDIAQYLKEGENNLVKLETNYIWSPAQYWSARLSAGIFEEMYGGVGGEILYAPAYRPWAVGVNVNRVRKRDFDQRFDFLDYIVTTGHLTGYFDLPFYKLHMNISAGRYLAGDWGSTLELSRRFDSGVVVGAFATKTDVSAADFGEGKFDKGFFLYIPLDVFFPRSTRRGASLGFRPLSRDGGQKVRDGAALYDMQRGGFFDPSEDWQQIMR